MKTVVKILVFAALFACSISFAKACQQAVYDVLLDGTHALMLKDARHEWTP